MVHPPRRGFYFLGNQPMVHKGFFRAWETIEQAVLEVVDTVLDTSPMAKELFRVVLTGKHLSYLQRKEGPPSGMQITTILSVPCLCSRFSGKIARKFATWCC